ncbi:MarR family transcriptional regulator [Leptolyngbya sp. FACHB-36]|nr:MarR family transcriptional regulator [Leptolyngbya sp. FACHB-36]
MTTKLAPTHNQLWRLLITAHVRLIDRVEQHLKQAGLPPLEWYDVLWALKETPDQRLRLSELADAVLLSRSNLTRLLDRLEKAGLLTREACPSDRRGTFAVLTPAGATLQQQMWEIYSQRIAEDLSAHLEDGDVRVMTNALSQILKAEQPEIQAR